MARQVAREQGLPEDWINADVAQFLSEQEAKRPLPAETFGPGISVTVPTAAYLLAMKLRACRPALPGYPGDEPDIRFLLGKIKPASRAEVAALFARFFPHDVLSEQAEDIVATTLANLS